MRTDAHQKVKPTHLKRAAFLYVRQSTLRQVFENVENTKRQYGLRQHAVALGWSQDQIIVIDSDLGQSGASAADREGFLNKSKDGTAMMWMALVHERKQKMTEAEIMYKSTLRTEDVDPADKATAMELYARFLRDRKRADEAKVIIDQAASIRETLGMGVVNRSPNVVTPDKSVTLPTTILMLDPFCGIEAKAAKYEGTVLLYAEVGSDGMAHNIRAVKGLGPGLDENAAATLAQWRFKPAMKDGGAVNLGCTLELAFRSTGKKRQVQHPAQ